MEFSLAVEKALASAGPSLFDAPSRFLSYVLDLADADSTELRVLKKNCDERLLGFYSQVARSGNSDALRDAATWATECLVRERMIADAAASATAEGIAKGIAGWRGIRYEVPKKEPARPAAQSAPKTPAHAPKPSANQPAGPSAQPTPKPAAKQSAQPAAQPPAQQVPKPTPAASSQSHAQSSSRATVQPAPAAQPAPRPAAQPHKPTSAVQSGGSAQNTSQPAQPAQPSAKPTTSSGPKFRIHPLLIVFVIVTLASVWYWKFPRTIGPLHDATPLDIVLADNHYHKTIVTAVGVYDDDVTGPTYGLLVETTVKEPLEGTEYFTDVEASFQDSSTETPVTYKAIWERDDGVIEFGFPETENLSNYGAFEGTCTVKSRDSMGHEFEYSPDSWKMNINNWWVSVYNKITSLFSFA